LRRWARPLALAVIRRGDAILVFEVVDEVKGVTGYRPPGGTIEFGERSEDAVIREIREELSAELTDLRPLGTLENIFRFRGEASHEIIVVYQGRLADATFYERETIDGVEANGERLSCSWRLRSARAPVPRWAARAAHAGRLRAVARAATPLTYNASSIRGKTKPSRSPTCR